MAQNYKTNQRRVIFEFILASGGKHLTAEGVFNALRERGREIGRATIYRYLDRLVCDGVLRRYVPSEGGGAIYEYCNCGGGHFHLKCRVCGKLLHLECADVSELFSHIDKDHNFRTDPVQTVFHGTCGKCMDRAEVKNL